MKKKENKHIHKNYLKGKYSVEEMTDEKFIALMEEAIKWFNPNVVEKQDDNGNTYKKDLHKDNLFIKQFLLEKDIPNRLIKDLFAVRPWLKDYYDDMKDYQEIKLTIMGLKRELDSSMVKFTLTNKHNWLEKSKNTDDITLKNVDLKKLVGFKENKK